MCEPDWKKLICIIANLLDKPRCFWRKQWLIRSKKIKYSTFGRVCVNYHKINYAFIFLVSLAMGHVAVETFAGFLEV